MNLPDHMIEAIIAGGGTIGPVAKMRESFAIPAGPTSEKDFLADVIGLAKRNGYLHYHTLDSRKCAAGFPDLVIVGKGKLIFAELKVGTNETSAAQDTWLDELRLAGVKAVVWRPEHWPSIVEALS